MDQSADQRVFLNGHIDVPQERLTAVREALPLHIDLTRAEPGCISFEVVEDDATPGRFLVSEVFVDQDAFDGHQARTKSSDWFKVTEGIPRDYKITTGSAE